VALGLYGSYGPKRSHGPYELREMLDLVGLRGIRHLSSFRGLMCLRERLRPYGPYRLETLTQVP